MLLRDILFDLFEDSRHDYDDDLRLSKDDFNVGCKLVPIAKQLKPEELEEFKKMGIQMSALSPVPVFYGYEMNFGTKFSKDATTTAMDKLKMRNGHERSAVEADVTAAMRYFARSLIRSSNVISLGKTNRTGANKMAIQEFQQYMKNKNTLKTILVMPSSSELPEILASAMADEIMEAGGKVEILPIDTLFKQAPKLSRKHMENLKKDTSGARDYAGDIAGRDELKAKLDKMNLDHPDYPATKRAYERLVQRVADNGTYQVKRHMNDKYTDSGKAYYGHIGANTHDVRDTVIIIDDNVVQGKTVGEAAKALVRLHRVPIKVYGVALHHFLSRKNNEDKADASSSGQSQIVAARAPRTRAVPPKSGRDALAKGVLNYSEVEKWLNIPLRRSLEKIQKPNKQQEAQLSELRKRASDFDRPFSKSWDLPRFMELYGDNFQHYNPLAHRIK